MAVPRISHRWLMCAATAVALTKAAVAAAAASSLFALPVTVGDGTGQTITYSGSASVSLGTLFSSVAPTDGNQNFLLSGSDLYGSLSGTNAAGAIANVAWDFNLTTGFQVVGPTTANANGYHVSPSIVGFSASGMIAGYSSRYSSSSVSTNTLGLDAWLQNPATGTAVSLGLTGANYSYAATTSPTGTFASSFPAVVSPSGWVAGNSSRYVGGTSSVSLGTAAWLYNPSTGSTADISLKTAGYFTNTASGSVSYTSSVTGMNASEQVVGTATVYSTGSNQTLGTDGWIYVSNSAVNVQTAIGLYQSGQSAAPFSSNTYGFSFASGSPFANRVTGIKGINSVGQVAGSSQAYLSGSSAYKGQEAFVFTPSSNYATGTYTIVGLYNGTPDATGATFIQPAGSNNPGFRSSTIQYLNNSGQSVGFSNLFTTNSTSSVGSATWFADAAGNTKEIGLRGYAPYIAGNALQERNVIGTQLTQTGLVGGYTKTYVDTTALGQDAWIYDSNTDTTYTIDTAHAGNTFLPTFSRIYSLTDSGYAVGTYGYKPNPVAAQTTNMPFFWSAISGLVDLTAQMSAAGYDPGSAGAGVYCSEDGATIFVQGVTTSGYPGIASVSVASKWNVGGSGAWSSSGNWANGVAPNAPGTLAVLGGGATAGPTTVALVDNTTVGSITLAGTNAYTVSGPGSLTITGVYTGAIVVTSGSHAISAPVVLGSKVGATISSGAALATSTVDGPFALSVSGGGTLTVTSRLDVASLAVDPRSLVDLGSGEAIFSSMSESSVRALISAWRATGYGLGSSLAGPLTTLAVITNDDGTSNGLFSTFDGATVSATDILVKYTYLGDTNLDGQVDSADLANLLAGMNGGLTGWINGDMNYDGRVDAADVTLLLDGLQGQGAPLGNPGGGTGAVPEAGGLTLLMPLGLLLRRRRVHRVSGSFQCGAKGKR